MAHEGTACTFTLTLQPNLMPRLQAAAVLSSAVPLHTKACAGLLGVGPSMACWAVCHRTVVLRSLSAVTLFPGLQAAEEVSPCDRNESTGLETYRLFVFASLFMQGKGVFKNIMGCVNFWLASPLCPQKEEMDLSVT